MKIAWLLNNIILCQKVNIITLMTFLVNLIKSINHREYGDYIQQANTM